MIADRTRFVRSLLLVIIAATSWGCWSLFLRPSGIPPSLAAPAVLVLMGLTLLPLRRFDRVTPRWDRETIVLLLAFAAFDALNISTYFAAMDVTTLGVAVLSHYLAPLIVAVAAPMLDGERVRGARWAALVATLGLALVLEPWRGAEAGRLPGALLGALSAFGYAGNVFVAARLVPRIGAARAVGYHAFLSAAILLPLVPAAAWATTAPTARGVLLLVAGGVTLGAISGWMFSRGLAVIGPTLASTLAFLEPLGAVVVGWLAWDERLSIVAAAGALLILGSGAWMTRARASGAR